MCRSHGCLVLYEVAAVIALANDTSERCLDMPCRHLFHSEQAKESIVTSVLPSVFDVFGHGLEVILHQRLSLERMSAQKEENEG